MLALRNTLTPLTKKIFKLAVYSTVQQKDKLNAHAETLERIAKTPSH